MPNWDRTFKVICLAGLDIYYLLSVVVFFKKNIFVLKLCAQVKFVPLALKNENFWLEMVKLFI